MTAITSDVLYEPAGTHEPHGAKTPKKAALASWIGSALEYYDFFIYGTAAALVFGRIFFPGADPKVGTVAAFATFGVGYVTRPIGAGPNGWMPVALFTTITAVIAAISAMTARETYKIHLNDLGRKDAVLAPA